MVGKGYPGRRDLPLRRLGGPGPLGILFAKVHYLIAAAGYRPIGPGRIQKRGDGQFFHLRSFYLGDPHRLWSRSGCLWHLHHLLSPCSGSCLSSILHSPLIRPSIPRHPAFHSRPVPGAAFFSGHLCGIGLAFGSSLHSIAHPLRRLLHDLSLVPGHWPHAPAPGRWLRGITLAPGRWLLGISLFPGGLLRHHRREPAVLYIPLHCIFRGHIFQGELGRLGHRILPDRRINTPGLTFSVEGQSVTSVHRLAGILHIGQLDHGAELAASVPQEQIPQEDLLPPGQQVDPHIAAPHVQLFHAHVQPAHAISGLQLDEPYIFSFHISFVFINIGDQSPESCHIRPLFRCLQTALPCWST